jgi:hypothetical protein
MRHSRNDYTLKALLGNLEVVGVGLSGIPAADVVLDVRARQLSHMNSMAGTAPTNLLSEEERSVDIIVADSERQVDTASVVVPDVKKAIVTDSTLAKVGGRGQPVPEGGHGASEILGLSAQGVTPMCTDLDVAVSRVLAVNEVLLR